jgi:RecJ-like exonuclease
MRTTQADGSLFADRYPTDTVMCPACSGTGEYDWGEIDVFTKCGTCGGIGEVEVCSQCHDSGDECGACGV